MTIDDQQLDSLLRDVDVPDDLKDQLRRIPPIDDVSATESEGRELKGAPSKANPHEIRRRLYVALAMAAGLSALALFLTWPRALDQPTVAVSSKGNTSAETVIAEMQFRWASIDALFEEVQISNLENLAATQRATAPLEPVQVEAFVLSLADQSAIQYGATTESVRADMKQVINRFPGTHGAEIAQRFLDSNPITQ